MVNNNTLTPHCEDSLPPLKVGMGKHGALEGEPWSRRKGRNTGLPELSSSSRMYCQTVFSVRVRPFGHPPLAPGRGAHGEEREDSPGSEKKQWSGQGPPGGSQARPRAGFPFFLSLILFLLSFFILDVLPLVWSWMSHSPTARVIRSRRRNNTLVRRQKESEAFSKG